MRRKAGRRKRLECLAHRKYAKKWILLNTKANKPNNRKIREVVREL